MDVHGHVRSAPPLRWLKWLSTLIASLAAVVTTGIIFHWAFGGEEYHWSALPIALGVTTIALAARQFIASKLDDRRSEAVDRLVTSEVLHKEDPG
jgi:hypothetical protein